MPAMVWEIVGFLGATLTTLCWLPQAMQLLRDRDARAISLHAYAAFALGLLFWLIYGIALSNLPLIGASAIEFTLAAAILLLKLRHG